MQWTNASTSKCTTSLQNFSMSAWLCIAEQQLGFSFAKSLKLIPQIPAELLLHIFQGLNKHHLKFHAFVWLHKQLSAATKFCLSHVDHHYPAKELRILFQLQICLSRGKLTILYNLVCSSGWSTFKLHAIEFKSKGGTEWLHCGAPVQGPSLMNASCTPVPITSNELNPVLLLLSSPKPTNLN